MGSGPKGSCLDSRVSGGSSPPGTHSPPACSAPHMLPLASLSPPPRENQYPTGNNLCHTEGESSVMPTHPFRAAERTVSAASGAIAPGNDTCPT